MSSLASSDQIVATWIVVLLYMAVILFFVVRGAIRVKTISDYALGSISFSPLAVGLALAASMTSAATFIINPGFIALYGLSGVLSFGIVMPLAIFVSLIVMTKRFRKSGSHVKALTMAQWMGKMYNSSSYGIFFAFLSLLLITFIVLICVGLTQVLSSALALEPLGVLVSVIVFVFGYMMFGGANSMVYTNAIQATLMLIVAVVLLASGADLFDGGLSGFKAQLEDIGPHFASWTNPESFLFRDYFEIIFCQVVIGIAIVCQPHVITKSLLLKDEQDVNRYLLIGILVLVVFFQVVIVGLFARLRFPDLMISGQPIPMDGIVSAYVVSEFSVYVTILVVLGLISAGLSTLEGLIQSLSASLTADLIKPLFGKRFSADPDRKSRQEVLVNKLVIVFLAIVSFMFSYQQLLSPNLSVGIFAQNGVYAYFSAAFVPVFFGMFIKGVRLKTVYTASIVAVVVHFSVYYGQFMPYMKETVNNPAIASTMALLMSGSVGLIMHYTGGRQHV
ncbi:sodium:solute symporter family transporter [Marinoscillum furvescens]|uniref:Sodium/pantothenate symporter n=1 Tax=Marinoscillum furvescens DSM 4134 TaxID=1122208 RepID=A0A3D9L1Z7_MARFU|nr:sodium:solute symporter [Marinoscillum furvescens]RED94945.1 sodium/pantothenate symporter [Marinoscillum furvescens DSM 4134]